MRSEEPSLIGRDHLAYRGYYAPVKGVIDGDLCERYRLLPSDKKQRIAAELDRKVKEVEKKISVCHAHPAKVSLTLYKVKDLANRRVTGRTVSICLLGVGS
jgi:hypothetical protein